MPIICHMITSWPAASFHTAKRSREQSKVWYINYHQKNISFTSNPHRSINVPYFGQEVSVHQKDNRVLPMEQREAICSAFYENQSRAKLACEFNMDRSTISDNRSYQQQHTPKSLSQSVRDRILSNHGARHNKTVCQGALP